MKAISADKLHAIDRLPSMEPEVIHCKDCAYHKYEQGSATPYCSMMDYGYGWQDDDFCSRAKRK